MRVWKYRTRAIAGKWSLLRERFKVGNGLLNGLPSALGIREDIVVLS
jgi:hypothetical protein